MAVPSPVFLPPLIAVFALFGGCEESSTPPETDENDCERALALEIEGCGEILGQSFCSEGRGHIPFGSPARYDANPPHSGPHYPDATFWGIHDGTVDRGTWVHNLEHGGIVLAYDCTDCNAEIQTLRDVVVERPDMRVLITRDVELPTRFAAISWTWVQTFDVIDSEALMCFIDQHEGFAPENIAK